MIQLYEDVIQLCEDDPVASVLANGNRTIETVTLVACTGCLHYNQVYTTKYGINSFKYHGVKIIKDLKKINIYQNNE